MPVVPVGITVQGCAPEPESRKSGSSKAASVHHRLAAKKFTCHGDGAAVIDGVGVAGGAVAQTQPSWPFRVDVRVAATSQPSGHVQPMDVVATNEGKGV